MMKVTIEHDRILVECEKCCEAVEIPLTEDYAESLEVPLGGYVEYKITSEKT